MPSILELQLSEQDRALYQRIEINTRTRTTLSDLRAKVVSELEYLGIAEMPVWLSSLLDDMASRDDDFWSTNQQEYVYISLERLVEKAFRAYCGSAVIIDKLTMPKFEGMIRHGFDPELPHMQWAKILDEKYNQLAQQYPEHKKGIYVSYIQNGEPHGIDFPLFVSLMQFRIDNDWYVLETGDFVEWYTSDLTKITPETEQFTKFIQDTSARHGADPITLDNYEDRFPFRDMHPVLQRKALDVFYAHQPN